LKPTCTIENVHGLLRAYAMNATNTPRLSAASTYAVANFDTLPESAKLDTAAVLHLACISRPTLYRMMDRGDLPRPRKLGASKNFWTVGEVRRALAGSATA
jgi:predicted DNA-binding transcriptional regulator AlpA